MENEQIDYSYNILSRRKAFKKEVKDIRENSPDLIFKDEDVIKLRVKTKYGVFVIVGLEYHIMAEKALDLVVQQSIDSKLGIENGEREEEEE